MARKKVSRKSRKLGNNFTQKAEMNDEVKKENEIEDDVEDDFEDFSEDEMAHEEPEETLDEVDKKDPFEKGRMAMEKGHRVNYHIKKNGELLGKFEHPFSWDKLQEMHGKGQ